MISRPIIADIAAYATTLAAVGGILPAVAAGGACVYLAVRIIRSVRN